MFYCFNINLSNYIFVVCFEIFVFVVIEFYGRGDKDSNVVCRFFFGMINIVVYGYFDCSVYLLCCMVLFFSNRIGIKINFFCGRLCNLVEVLFVF